MLIAEQAQARLLAFQYVQALSGACAAYVDLNPIRAALVEMLEESNYTSTQRRISALLLEQQTKGTLICTNRTPIKSTNARD